ncbi:transcriptional regulator [Humitalea rosea]|uniref:Transcriptional regulator n=1 Tax=Humitalea rosea TaxID=990373 RepID=A0A2W7I6P5_9PROT|nr:winged helix-turn-helix domain-containing protein [Humitalea rosea]PZW42324.1 transcriptional regulator [Humitalea rosea]
MHDSLAKLLWQLSEAGEPAVMFGRQHTADQDAMLQRLLALGVLLHGEPVTTWDPCGDCDCGADERRIRWNANMPFAACAADHRRDQQLAPDDVRTLSVAIPTLIQEAATATGLGQVEEIALGIWRLGRLPDGRVVVAAPTRAALLQPGLVGAVRMVDREGPIVLIGPTLGERDRALLASQGVHHVTPCDALASSGSGPPLAFDIGLLPDGRAGMYRLALTIGTRTVRLGEQETSLPPRPFQLLNILALQHRRGKPIVSRHALLDEIFTPSTAEAAVRDLVGELRKKLKQAFGDSEEVAQLIATHTTAGYAISLPPLTVSMME